MAHRLPLATGASVCIFWGADATGKFRAMDYFNGLSSSEQAPFVAQLHRFAATDTSRVSERLERCTDGLLLFRTPDHCLVGFAEQRDIVLIDAFSRSEHPGNRPLDRLGACLRLRQDHRAQGVTDDRPA